MHGNLLNLRRILRRCGARCAAAAIAALSCTAQAQTADGPNAAELPEAAENLSLHAQATYVRQFKPAFGAAYSGPRSLSPQRETSDSFTATAFLGLRLAPQTALYFNPEAVQGVPMSNLAGLGGLTNSELQKTAGPNLLVYRARLFVRQTWGLGGGTEQVEADANQLAGSLDKRRITLTAGNFAASDLFDGSAHAHDGRTQFLNWALLTHGAYDFAADSRGYSWGAALEYRHSDDWTLRAGRFLLPRESNGLALDPHFFSHHGDQVELERRYTAAGRPGTLRLLAFRNTAVMGGYRDALANAQAGGTVPTIDPVRKRRSKIGAGINLEQQVADEVGVFARVSASDGRSEPYAFAEIDQAVSFGTTVGGGRWGRAQDALGLALAVNGLSHAHRDFLAAGGTGFFVGDGRLHYRPEQIAEAYYRFAFPDLVKLDSALSLGVQFIRNPGYNADRGPVRVASLRWHSAF